MTTRVFLLIALLCLAPLATPAAQAKTSIDILGCVFSPIDPWSFCEVGFGPSCTSTSACLGADVLESGKRYECVTASVCTPYLPLCVRVTVWFQDWPENPSIDNEYCRQNVGAIFGLP